MKFPNQIIHRAFLHKNWSGKTIVLVELFPLLVKIAFSVTIKCQKYKYRYSIFDKSISKKYRYRYQNIDIFWIYRYRTHIDIEPKYRYRYRMNSILNLNIDIELKYRNRYQYRFDIKICNRNIDLTKNTVVSLCWQPYYLAEITWKKAQVQRLTGKSRVSRIILIWPVTVVCALCP